MSLYQELVCDTCADTWSLTNGGYKNAQAARRAAKAYGWVRTIKPPRDYCSEKCVGGHGDIKDF